MIKKIILIIIAVVQVVRFYANNDLFEALTTKNIEYIKKAIESGTSPDQINYGNSRQDTLLIEAITSGSEELALFLIEKGADVNASNQFGCTALHYAAFNGMMTVVLTLIVRGAKINASDNNLWTPLMNAVLHGDLRIVMILCQVGANMNAVNSEEETSFDIAQREEMKSSDIGEPSSGIFAYIAENGGKTGKYISEYRSALKNKDWNRVRELFDLIPYPTYNPFQYDTPLNYAILSSQTEILKMMLDAGLPPNIHIMNRKTPLENALSLKNKEMVQLLLDKGAVCKNPDTYLSLAIYNNDLAFAEYVLTKFPITLNDPDKQPMGGPDGTYLFYAITTNNEPLLRLLFKYKADPNLEIYGGTSLKKAIDENRFRGTQNIDIIKLLLDNHARTDSIYERKSALRYTTQMIFGYSQDFNKKYQSEQFHVNDREKSLLLLVLERSKLAKDNPDMMLLSQIAASMKDPQFGITLLAKTFSILAIYPLEEHPVTIAFRNSARNSERIKTLLQGFIEAGFTLNQSDAMGNTLLHYAVIADNIDAVKFCIESGVPHDTLNKQGKRAIELVNYPGNQIYMYLKDL